MCPLIQELDRRELIQNTVCLTGQHREMLQQVIDIFGTHIDFHLDIMKTEQTLTTITSDILIKIEDVYKSVQPDVVLVHGDTSTSFAGALAGFYQQIRVGHVEAGLRTYNKLSPYPEEMNRVLTSQIASLHFCPTKLNQQNLLAEGIKNNVFITGNTVIDAFATTVKADYVFKDSNLLDIRLKLASNNKLILVTAHRRENLGKPLENICKAIRRLHDTFTDVYFIYPVHLNPKIQKPVNLILGGLPRVRLIPPLDVEDLHNLMSLCKLVLTDSGGLQEEAPAFGVPVLVMRTETERPEAVEAGTVKVVGTEENSIFQEALSLLTDEESYAHMSRAINPYGDGHASERIANILEDKALWDAIY